MQKKRERKNDVIAMIRRDEIRVIENMNQLDCFKYVGRWVNIKFSPSIWTGSQLARA